MAKIWTSDSWVRVLPHSCYVPCSLLLTLLTASGDLRNVMKTVVELLVHYQKQCRVITNDRDPDIAIHNVMILLVAFAFPNGDASKLIVHLWYSSAIPSSMYLAGIIERLVPMVRQICEIIEDDADTADITTLCKFESPHKSSSSLTVTLKKREWLRMLKSLTQEEPLSLDLANKNQRKDMFGTSSTSLKDLIEYGWFLMSPDHRISDRKWRNEESFSHLGIAQNILMYPTHKCLVIHQSLHW